MIGFVASRSLRCWGTAAAVVFAGLVVSPRASEAGCGDYVQIRGRLVPMAHSGPDQGAGTDATPQDAADHGSHHRPCHGPTCSKGSFPVESPAPAVVVSVDRWAMASGETLPILVCCDSTLAEPSDFVADGLRLSILRPPK